MVRLFDYRLGRYGVAGGLSLLTHLLVLVVLVEGFDRAPVLSSITGFLCSVLVSYVLQHRWVFRTSVPVSAALPRFLVVTLVGLVLNALVMGAALNLLALHYLVAQGVAFVVVPVSNYLLNRAWTFNEGPGVHRIPAVEFAILVLATGLWVAFGFAGSIHLDLARDMMRAADLLAGTSVPLTGPVLAGVVHLGPIWFYLLALLQLVGEYGTVAVALALLAAGQFWLAWALADRLNDRPAGLIWIGLLLVPTWSTFELILLSHPALTGLTVAAVLLFGVRFFESGQTAALAGLSLSFVLGLHAHPTVVVLWPLPLGLAILGWLKHRFDWRQVLVAVLVGFLPFVPWLVDQMLSGWPITQALTTYADGGHTGRVAAAGPLLWQMTGGGLIYWLSVLHEGTSSLQVLAGIAFAMLVAIGLLGAVRRAGQGDRIVLMMLITVVLGAAGLALVRGFYPFYMLSGVRMVLLGVAAFGLSHWLFGRRWALRAGRSVAIAGLGLGAIALAAFHSQQRQGNWPFAFVPLMSVTAEARERLPHPFLTPWSAAASGDWLCAHGGDVMHGAYALAIIHGYGSEAYLRCTPQRIDVHGTLDGAVHRVGLSLALLGQLQIIPDDIIGPFGLVSVTSLHDAESSLEVTGLRDYPPLPVRFDNPETRRVHIHPELGGLLVVTDLTFGISLRPEVRALCGETELAPLARDNISWVFDPESCPESIVLELESPLPRYLNVVSIERPG